MKLASITFFSWIRSNTFRISYHFIILLQQNIKVVTSLVVLFYNVEKELHCTLFLLFSCCENKEVNSLFAIIKHHDFFVWRNAHNFISIMKTAICYIYKNNWMRMKWNEWICLWRQGTNISGKKISQWTEKKTSFWYHYSMSLCNRFVVLVHTFTWLSNCR